jgi:ABC-type Fe3+ transport system substrate-binding protein
MVTGMRQVWGEDTTREWLEGIMANEPTFYEKNTPTVAAVGAGEVDIGFVIIIISTGSFKRKEGNSKHETISFLRVALDLF